jgi:hypothetical protein
MASIGQRGTGTHLLPLSAILLQLVKESQREQQKQNAWDHLK